MKDLKLNSFQDLKNEGKSFYWASFFLSKEIFNKCSALYNFCRTLDDVVDNDSRLDVKKENFFKFKKDFTNKNFNNMNKIFSLIFLGKKYKYLLVIKKFFIM